MNAESSPAPLALKPRRDRTSTRCCTACLALLVLPLIILVILSLTLYKDKHPTTTVNSVSLGSLTFSLPSCTLNLTLYLGLSIHNPNRARFKYRNSTALLNFDGQVIGQVPIPAGKIGARETEALNLTLTIFADRLLMDTQADINVLAGSLPLNTHTKITGKVTIFGFVKVHVVSTTSCDFDLFVYNETIGYKQCEYKTKL